MSARVVNGVLAVLVLLAAGATSWAFTLDESDGSADATVEGVGTRPGVNSDDGTYTVGSLPDADEHDALVAAVETASSALSWDYRSLDAGLADATAGMTETFAEEFGQTFDSITRPRAKENQSVTEALVRGAGVVSEDDGRVRCLLFVDQVVVSSKTARDPDDPLDIVQSRVYLELEQVDGDWRVDAIGTVGRE